MIILLLLGLLLLATSVVIAARALGAPTKTSARMAQIQSYGFSEEALPGSQLRGDDAPSSRFGSLASRIGNLVDRRLGSVRPEATRRELLAAGMYNTSPAMLLGYRALLAVLLAVLAVLAAAAGENDRGTYLLMLPFAVLAGWLFPLAFVRRRAKQRGEAIDRELPNLIDLLVVTVEAGLGFAASLRLAAKEFSGPLADELRLTLQEQAMGLSLNEALVNMLDRVETPAMRSFVRSVIQGESLGVSIGTIMRNLGIEMRKRRRQSAEERAHKAPVKLLFPLVFLIFPAIFIVVLAPALLQLQDAFD